MRILNINIDNKEEAICLFRTDEGEETYALMHTDLMDAEYYSAIYYTKHSNYAVDNNSWEELLELTKGLEIKTEREFLDIPW